MEKNSAGAIWNHSEVILRVLYCSENYCPHDHRFLSAVADSNQHEVFWFRLEGSERVQEEREFPQSVHLVEWNVKESVVHWLDYPHLKRKFAAVIEKINPDVIHAGPIQRVAFLAALNDFHPLISMSWGFDMLQDAHRNLFWKSVTRYVLNKSDWLIADCYAVKNMASKFGFTSENVTVFPWGVDLDLFSPDNRKQARKKIGYSDGLLIIHTRSWELRYGVGVALRGLKSALDSRPNIHMLMLGGGSQGKQVKQFVRENGMDDNVHFLGYQSNEKLVDFYRAGDIYLSASHVDGSSVALLEAMSCGCVPVVSDIPSNQEWVTDDVEGWTFNDGSAKDLSDVLINVANGRDRLTENRVAARAKIEKFADWDKGIQKLLQTYEIAAAL